MYILGYICRGDTSRLQYTFHINKADTQLVDVFKALTNGVFGYELGIIFSKYLTRKLQG